MNVFDKKIRIKHGINKGGKVFGVRENQYIDDFDKMVIPLLSKAPNLLKEVSAQDGVYIFHFWGSRCVPCMKKMPYLQELFSRVDNHRIKVINVALVNSLSNLIRTEGVIDNQNLLGINVLEHLMEKSGYIQRLNISIYPFYIVVTNDGKVIFRSDEMGKKHDLEEFLQMNDYLEY